MRAYKYPNSQLTGRTTAEVLQPVSPYGLSETGARPVPDASASPVSLTTAAGSAPPIGGMAKRIFDIAVAITVLVLSAPLLILIAASIKLAEGGPVLFRQSRVGHKGRSFECLKFRTMATNAQELLERHLDKDPAAR